MIEEYLVLGASSHIQCHSTQPLGASCCHESPSCDGFVSDKSKGDSLSTISLTAGIVSPAKVFPNEVVVPY